MTSTQRSSQTYKYAIPGKKAKDALNPDEQELYELCSLAGVEMSPAVFRIIMSLLKMNVSPIAIVQMLKSMVNQKATISATSLTSSSSADSDITRMTSLPSQSAKRSASASAVSGVSSTSRSLKGTSRSGSSIKSDNAGKSRSTKSYTRT